MIEKITAILNENKVVALPTDTVWGFIARADSKIAIDRLYEIKQRPNHMPLQMLVATIEQAQELAVFSNAALQLAKTHWAGALTLVLQASDNNPYKHIIAGDGSIGLRVPDDPLLQQLIIGLDCPLVASSVNISGQLPCEDYETILQQFADSMPHDLGFIAQGQANDVASTVVDMLGDTPIILRQGEIII